MISGAGGNDDIYGGKAGDRLQSGLGQDDLFGQKGNDFANALDGQGNDSVDCGAGDNDIAGVDFLSLQGGPGDDNVSDDCEVLYVAFLICPCPGGQRSAADAVADLPQISSVKEAEKAVEAGLLKKVER